jgi:hypothetical protein
VGARRIRVVVFGVVDSLAALEVGSPVALVASLLVAVAGWTGMSRRRRRVGMGVGYVTTRPKILSRSSCSRACRWLCGWS